MRIQPDQPTLPAERPTAASASSDGFASALSWAQNSNDPSLGAWTDKSHAGEKPAAERWGQWGSGASAAGFGPPPDPTEFSDVPVGPDEPASPLNSSGVTTTPGFTVPGYTARGTPIAPGFYNLAYYNWYLRDGGTPLAGFPLHEAGATLTETYGSFGDGAERATSFVTAAGGDGGGDGGTPAPNAGAATGALAGAVAASSAVAAPATVASALVDAADDGDATAPESVAPRTAASAAPAAASERAATEAPDPARVASAAATGSTLRGATADLATLARTELAALLSDLLRAG